MHINTSFNENSFYQFEVKILLTTILLCKNKSLHQFIILNINYTFLINILCSY